MFDYCDLFPILAVGADLLDITGKHSIDHENRLEEIGTTFELTRQQEIYQLTARQRAQLLQNKYHSMHESIWDKGYRDEQNSFPETYVRHHIVAVLSWV